MRWVQEPIGKQFQVLNSTHMQAGKTYIYTLCLLEQSRIESYLKKGKRMCSHSKLRFWDRFALDPIVVISLPNISYKLDVDMTHTISLVPQ